MLNFRHLMTDSAKIYRKTGRDANLNAELEYVGEVRCAICPSTLAKTDHEGVFETKPRMSAYFVTDVVVENGDYISINGSDPLEIAEVITNRFHGRLYTEVRY